MNHEPAPTHPAPEAEGHLRYLLTAYIFDSLSPAGRAEVEEHLAACADCRLEMEELGRTLAHVVEALADPGAGPAGYSFEARRLERVLTASRTRPWARRRLFVALAATVVVVALLGILGVGLQTASRKGTELAYRAPASPARSAPGIGIENALQSAPHLEEFDAAGKSEAKIQAFREYGRSLAIQGEDAIAGSPDDRIVIAGGESAAEASAAEPTAPTSEILLPPGVTERKAGREEARESKAGAKPGDLSNSQLALDALKAGGAARGYVVADLPQGQRFEHVTNSSTEHAPGVGTQTAGAYGKAAAGKSASTRDSGVRANERAPAGPAGGIVIQEKMHNPEDEVAAVAAGPQAAAPGGNKSLQDFGDVVARRGGARAEGAGASRREAADRPATTPLSREHFNTARGKRSAPAPAPADGDGPEEARAAVGGRTVARLQEQLDVLEDDKKMKEPALQMQPPGAALQGAARPAEPNARAAEQALAKAPAGERDAKTRELHEDLYGIRDLDAASKSDARPRELPPAAGTEAETRSFHLEYRRPVTTYSEATGKEAERLGEELAAGRTTLGSVLKPGGADGIHGWAMQTPGEAGGGAGGVAGTDALAPVFTFPPDAGQQAAGNELLGAQQDARRRLDLNAFFDYEAAGNQPRPEEQLRAYAYYQNLDKNLSWERFRARPIAIPPPAPRGEEMDQAAFLKVHHVNPFVDTRIDHLSTFAMDVDTASFTRARSVLAAGKLPDPGAVRVEEFVNYFREDCPADPDTVFSVFSEGGPSPFGAAGLDLLKITVKARELRANERRDAVLTFAIDASGSMHLEDRLELVKAALGTLIGSLGPDDRVGIVAYGTQAYLVLPHTPARERARILGALESLRPHGASNVEAGLELAYRAADDVLQPRALNRVILCSDGVANAGARGPEEILKKVKVFATRGIYLTTVGFGRERYNDRMMERLANEGNGNYAFVAGIEEAERIFRANLPSTLQVLAQDAKIQVDFNPDTVSHYRLLGYENRDVKDAQFRDDAVDAGEVGPGSTVTALYEIRRRPSAAGALGRVFVRFRDTTTGRVAELNYPLAPGVIATSPGATTERFRFIACAAEAAELLRTSYWAQDGSYGKLLETLHGLSPAFQARPEWRELVEVAGRAQALTFQQLIHWQAQRQAQLQAEQQKRSQTPSQALPQTTAQPEKGK